MSAAREQAYLDRIAALELENKLLREKIDLLVRKVFGRSSEQVDVNQLTLLPEAPPVGKVSVPDSARSGTKPSKLRVARLPEHLPVVEEIIEPAAVQQSPQDWRLIGTEVSEQLDYQPGHFFRRRLVRRKYVSKLRPRQAPVLAPLPPCLQERGLAAPGLLAHIIANKYVAHLPLYRQQQLFRQRHGVDLPWSIGCA